MTKFKRTKKRLLKAYPGAELSSTPNGQFYIGQKGKNIIGEEYPDLAISDSAWEAWRNLDTVEYWNRFHTNQEGSFLIRVDPRDLGNNDVSIFKWEGLLDNYILLVLRENRISFFLDRSVSS